MQGFDHAICLQHCPRRCMTVHVVIHSQLPLDHTEDRSLRHFATVFDFALDDEPS